MGAPGMAPFFWSFGRGDCGAGIDFRRFLALNPLKTRKVFHRCAFLTSELRFWVAKAEASVISAHLPGGNDALADTKWSLIAQR